MDELWEAAGEDFGRMQRESSLALADAELEAVMPFLLAARTPGEYAHRSALAQESIRSIAARTGVDEDELMATARRRFELYRQALMEGADPMSQLERALDGSGYGSGPEKPDEHDEGPDYSHGYSEVPAGPLGGPDPRVTAPRPEAAGPVQEATGSLRRQADSDPGSMMTMPYMPMPTDTGTGPGSVDQALPSPAAGGMTPSLPAGVNGSGDDTVPITPPTIGQVTSSADPVRRRVMAVTAAIASTNPHLPQAECERVARVVVGRYLREADISDSVVSDAPYSPSAGGGSGGGESSSGGEGSSSGGGGGAVQHMLEGQGLRSMIPGMGGGGAGAGGAAAEELAPLAAL